MTPGPNRQGHLLAFKAQQRLTEQVCTGQFRLHGPRRSCTIIVLGVLLCLLLVLGVWHNALPPDSFDSSARMAFRLARRIGVEVEPVI